MYSLFIFQFYSLQEIQYKEKMKKFIYQSIDFPGNSWCFIQDTIVFLNGSEKKC